MSEQCAVCDEDKRFLVKKKKPSYDALQPQIKVVDLFCGCGGLSLGLAEAARRGRLGTSITLAMDTDANVTAVYKTNFPKAHVVQDSVERHFDGAWSEKPTAAERTIARKVGRVDVMVGGPPCQGHSDLNNHTRRDDSRNDLYLVMARAARILKPRVVIIENVPSVQHDAEQVVATAMEALRELGYSVAETILDITALGAPQRRKRHVVLAIKRLRTQADALLDNLNVRCVEHPARSLTWAIGDLKRIRGRGLLDSPSSPSDKNIERIDYLFENKLYDLPNDQRPPCHQTDHSYVSMYGRLNWREPAQTVTTGFGSMGQGRYVHPSQRRTLTPHEAARLQMLPDFWDFTGVKSRGALARMIGNAVPPVLTLSIGEALVPLLNRTTSKATAGTKGGRPSGAVPAATTPGVRRRMIATRQSGTRPEAALLAVLDRSGLGYKRDVSPVAGVRSRADIVFPEARVAIYIDGCYWHGCPDHATLPKVNVEWWREKLLANQARDDLTNRRLQAAGWTVLRFWEHQDPEEASAVIVQALDSGHKSGMAV